MPKRESVEPTRTDCLSNTDESKCPKFKTEREKPQQVIRLTDTRKPNLDASVTESTNKKPGQLRPSTNGVKSRHMRLRKGNEKPMGADIKVNTTSSGRAKLWGNKGDSTWAGSNRRSNKPKRLTPRTKSKRSSHPVFLRKGNNSKSARSTTDKAKSRRARDLSNDVGSRFASANANGNEPMQLMPNKNTARSRQAYCLSNVNKST